MTKDILFLLPKSFTDANHPDKLFYCPHCLPIEGALASFKDQLHDLDVRHEEFPRPRQNVIALAGEDNQSLPLLVLGKGRTTSHKTGEYNGRQLVAGSAPILAALAELYGIPVSH
ncbi:MULTISPECIES: DUF3088 domain-containing protein [Bartonella]|uniref:DUF3088 domain-containing protein n=1 Tax=Bartonella choladocola TaxID=2750995 RepID=A0A1U9MJI8_9HYPH|nr:MULTISPECIES: DUF3088 domain-containing protein [Bartonella]AQT48074.1 Protein of unknown function (DUF3088) [Bartonella choladocola]MBH9975912.1 DUF3088 domain-containing protein [Bartonella choladocola]MBI0015746.1 DUF3088 domain-containing protein [Bartonella sp. B10834G3]MBI0141370.1 DUF3088 domain-containing protein [Bartonella choladocola]